MTDNLTNFDDTSDVSDAAIEWVLRELNYTAIWCPNGVRGEVDDENRWEATIILAARLIQQHRPNLLVDPVDAIVREELAKAYEAEGLGRYAKSAREGDFDEDVDFIAAKRLYLIGLYLIGLEAGGKT